MKKITLVLALIMLLGMSVTSAEIGRGTDDFDGSQWVTSGTVLNSNGEWIGFQRKTIGAEKEYYISLASKAFSYIKFAKEDAEIKIDDHPVGKMKIKEVSSMPAPLDSKMSYIDVKSVVPMEIVQQIKTAKRVAVKFYRENSVPEVYVLPDAVLAEWKEVINMEK